MAGLEAVTRLDTGRAELVGRKLHVTGVTSDEETGLSLPQVVRAAANRSCEDVVEVKLDLPPEPELKWQARADQTKVRLTGEVPNSQIKETLVKTAKTLFGKREIVDEMRVKPARSTKWPKVAGTLLEMLAKLREGEANIDGQSIGLLGQAPDTSVATAIQTRLKRGLSKGYTGGAKIEIKSDAMIWAEQEAKRQEEARRIAGQKRLAAEEAQRQAEEEAARTKAEEEKRRAAEEAARQARTRQRARDQDLLAKLRERRARLATEERRRAEEAAARKKAAAAARRQAELRQQANDARLRQLAQQRRQRLALAEQRRQAEAAAAADARRRTEEAARKAAEDRRKAAEARRRAAQEAAEKKAQADRRRAAERARREAEARRQAGDAELRRRLSERRQRLAEEARRKAEAKAEAERRARDARLRQLARQRRERLTPRQRATETVKVKRCESNFGKVIGRNRIQFRFESAQLLPSSRRTLNRIIRMINSCSGLLIEIGGHTDSLGRVEGNLRLSERRALAVFNDLVAGGVPAERLVTKGYGETKPRFRTRGIRNRALNRRIEFRAVWE